MRPLGPRLRAPLGLVLARPSQPPLARPRAAAAGWQLPNSRCASAASAARPPRSQFLQRRPDQEQAAPAGGEAAGAPAAAGGGEKQGAQQPQRYGPLDVDLQPKDQLRPLLPTWNPPPTRRPRPEELELSARLRFLLEDRWWAATIREVGEGQVKVGYDGWPSRHDEWVPLDSDRLYLHESHHADYVAPPLPKRYERQSATDAEGNPIVTIRPPRPKVYDPEKERLKRMLRPPLPYNPEKEGPPRVGAQTSSNLTRRPAEEVTTNG
ncbi:unnamed protein product [Prorocentrum cordatum]|uniref:Uncharacterized protein n=1 Tax=Prorocentrum cordatum TaxID=2364126 RepID=A0ABN9TRQ9_9DINO|nr:unnamed protein product [Polarella glacialis]